jgi:tetratricopeptide (TPR) repeat protein
MISKENGFTLPVIIKFPESKKYIFTFIALLAALFLIYSNSFNGEWHFDDSGNIIDNARIQIKSFSWPEIKNIIYDTDQKKFWRPLSVLSFALNYKFGGTDVFGFHVVNFIIHYLASAFLFLFIFNTLKLPRLKDEYENIAYPVALLATFFWALNPVHINCITYIVQRYASMVGLFYIMSMYFYLKGRTSAKSTSSFIFFILCMIAGLAAVLTKENAVMLPVSILLFDLFLIQGVTRENLKKYIMISLLPFLLILIIGFIYTSGFSNFFGFPDLLSGYKIRGFTLAERLLTEPRVIVFYLSLLFYPISSRLDFLYDVEISRSLFQPWRTIPSILLILSMIGFAFYIARKRPLISFCIIFYFLNHLMEGSIFNLELIYDYRNYLPSMLLFIPFAHFMIYAVDYFSYKKTIQFIVALGIAIILFAEGDITYSRNKIVSDDALLWFDNIEKAPLLSRPHASMGAFYFNHNEKEKGLEEFKKATILNNWGGSNQSAGIQEFNLGIYYFLEMQDDLAMEHLRKSSNSYDYIQNFIHIAKIKLRQNKIKEVEKVIKDKIKENPDKLELLELYSFILLKEGRINDAQYFARKCLAKNQNSLNALQIMAETCRLKNNYTGAISYWKSVRSVHPQNAYANLALIEIYKIINDKKMLNQEISLLLNLKGSFILDEYIQNLDKDEKLLIYIPKIENYSFITSKCSFIN